MRASLLISAALACTSLLLVLPSFAEAQAPRTPTPFPYTFETRSFTVPLDNFNFAASGQTFQIKYLIAQQYYKKGGPIFFYSGNEGPIELFCNNTGFMSVVPFFLHFCFILSSHLSLSFIEERRKEREHGLEMKRKEGRSRPCPHHLFNF